VADNITSLVFRLRLRLLGIGPLTGLLRLRLVKSYMCHLLVPMRSVMAYVFLHAALACCTEYNMIVTT